MGIAKYTYYFSSIFTLLKGIKPTRTLLSLFLKTKSVNPVEIQTESPFLRILVRSAMDVWSVKEAVLDRFYEKYGFTPEDGWTVIDIGAAIGEFGLYVAKLCPNARVYAFEPTPISYTLLERNTRVNELSNLTPVQSGVWSKDDKLVIHTAIGESLQFTSEEAGPEPIANGDVRVDSLSFATIRNRYGLDEIDLMKLDCEGAEYEILMQNPVEELHKVRRIVMEYHDVPGHHHDELARYLHEHGYRVEIYNNVVHDDIGYISAIRA